jgi:hypothetical protein
MTRAFEQGRGDVRPSVCRRTDRRVGKCSNGSYGRQFVKRPAACSCATKHEVAGITFWIMAAKILRLKWRQQ